MNNIKNYWLYIAEFMQENNYSSMFHNIGDYVAFSSL